MSSSRYAPVFLQDDDVENNQQHPMQESFVPIPSIIDTVVAGTPQIEVIAPADLPEGYEFRVSCGSTSDILVVVPPGGVEKGQKWTVPLPMSDTPRMNIPVGHWRDSLAGIFTYGLCHPHCWTACCCTLRQVIRRLQFTWQGQPTSSAAASARAFAIVFYITAFHMFMYVVLYLSIFILDPDSFEEPTPECAEAYKLYEDDLDEMKKKYPECAHEPTGLLLAILLFYDLLKYFYLIITIWLVYNVRRSVRAKYAIPGSPIDDCCWSFWCPCLVAGQMLRHTTDYNIYPSQLLTATGLSEKVPSIV